MPVRPPKGGVVALAGYDPTRLNELMPHPLYAWMQWVRCVQILAPAAAAFEQLVKERWERRRAA